MNAKKWVLTFLLLALVLALGLAAFNYVTDPFAAFGDRFLNWFSYDETNNPRVAKISYLEQHHDEYDSYILGCSSTSSLQVSDFNKLYDANFYNLIMYGADMRDCEKIADYLIEHYEVKHLVLNVYLDNGLTYDEEIGPADAATSTIPERPGHVRAVLLHALSVLPTRATRLAKLNALRTDRHAAAERSTCSTSGTGCI